MLKDSGTEKAGLFTEYLNEKYPGSQTTWSGPPEEPARYVFDMRGANKRIVVAERIFDLWGSTKTTMGKTLSHHGFERKIEDCPAGSELHVTPGVDEKPEFEVKQLHAAHNGR